MANPPTILPRLLGTMFRFANEADVERWPVEIHGNIAPR
jgi:hypothetical protein